MCIMTERNYFMDLQIIHVQSIGQRIGIMTKRKYVLNCSYFRNYHFHDCTTNQEEEEVEEKDNNNKTNDMRILVVCIHYSHLAPLSLLVDVTSTNGITLFFNRVNNVIPGN